MLTGFVLALATGMHPGCEYDGRFLSSVHVANDKVMGLQTAKEILLKSYKNDPGLASLNGQV